MTFLNRLGPGLLYAAAAVGTSHLVQSTRAGADYSFSLVLIFILVAILKYPGIRFGKDYAQATGKNLIDSYASLGSAAILIYAVVIGITMVFVTAALALVTNALFQTALSLSIEGSIGTIGCILLTGALLFSGRYSMLERVNKLLVPLFTILIFVVTAIAVSNTDWSAQQFSLPSWDTPTIMYVIAIAGWLLTPMDGSVLVSLWTEEKMKNQTVDPKDAMFDFNLGYWISLLLAMCFITLGASMIYGSGSQLPSSGGAFAGAIIALFSEQLGAWLFPVIALIALSIMYSTLITVMDGYARNVEKLLEIASLGSVEKNYYVGVVTVCLGGILVVAFFMQSFTTFIDLVGALVFILGPIYALLNHRAVFGGDIPSESQPSQLMKVWSIVGIVVMSVVAIGYVYLRWFS